MQPLETIRAILTPPQPADATGSDDAPRLLARVIQTLRETPVELPGLGLTLTADAAALHLPAGTETTCVEGRFLVFGRDQADAGHLLAVDITDPALPVCLVAIDPVDVITVIAPAIPAFMAALVQVLEHRRTPRYLTGGYFAHEHALHERLAALMGGPRNLAWWIGRLAPADTRDTYWSYLAERQDPIATRTAALADFNFNEAIFGLFSIIPPKVRTSIRFIQLSEKPAAVPVLLDLMTVTPPGSETWPMIMSAVVSCGSGAIPFLRYAVREYPHPAGRTAAARLLAALNWTPLADILLEAAGTGAGPDPAAVAALLGEHTAWLIEEGPHADAVRTRIMAAPRPVPPPPGSAPAAAPPVYPIAWPPINESDMARTKTMSALFILLAVFLTAGIFYLKTGYWVSMVLGAAAAAGAMFFLPDITMMILGRRLRHAGYADRIIDTSTDRPRLDALVAAGDVARCIDYAGAESANSLGYLVYLYSDLAQGESRPRVVLCAPDELAAAVDEWYTQGRIPPDGLRTPAIRAFWETLPGPERPDHFTSV
ncbi:MAG: hypothetical protein ABIF71_09300 [Planctomycetota bacterium]